MDLATFEWLLTPDGQALLAQAMDADLSESARLATVERLRRLAGAERGAAVYEIALLRQRASAKFSGAARMYFTRESLEQASGERIAAQRATRYARLLGGNGQIADLCCGVGGDTLALAAVSEVTAVDRDPLRLAMMAANAHALGLAQRVRPLALDLERQAPPHAGALFFDPARRSDGRRVFALKDYAPPVTLVAEWRTHTPAMGMKVAPGISDEDLAAMGFEEAEFVSLDGELKEACLWFGPLASIRGRRATVLSSLSVERWGRERLAVERSGVDPPPAEPRNAQRSTLNPSPATLTDETPSAVPPPPVREPQTFLYEPDPAIIRAQLVTTLAHLLGASQLDRQIAYLTSDQATATPFARCWHVIEWLPFSLKALRARLRALDAGPVTVKKRGSPLDTDALARQLSGNGARPLVVALTQVGGRHAAIVCEGPVAL
jgi:hypothetical protein